VAKVLSIRALGLQQVRRKLSSTAAFVEDPRPALEIVVEDMFRVISATFDSQGRRYGGSWAGISPKWRARKIAQGKDPRILHYNLYLRRAFTERGADHQILTVSKTSISLRSDLPYANVQNAKRPFVNFYPQDRARWVAIMEKELRRAFDGV
jgi:phage gpG-like protein